MHTKPMYNTYLKIQLRLFKNTAHNIIISPREACHK